MSSKIAVISPSASKRGGIERVAWDLLAYLAPRHEVAFIGVGAPDGLPEGAYFERVIRERRVPRSFAPLAFRRGAMTGLARLAPDATLSLGAVSPAAEVLWTTSVHRAWLEVARSVPVGRFSVPARARFVMPRHRVLLAMERQYFTSTNMRAVICTSQREVDDLAHYYDVDPAITTVLPNPFDPHSFNIGRRTSERAAARERLGVGDDEFALLFVANELHRKGFGETLSALAELRDDRLSLHLIGRRPPTSYAAIINQLGLTGSVRYHGPAADIASWYAGGDLLVLPTQYEPFGLVIVEALACGLPVITTRLAGASEAVEHGVTGLIQEDPYDAHELASLIRTAVSSDLEAWGTRGAESVTAYRRDEVMARVETILLAG